MTLQTHGYLEQVKKTDKYMVGPKAFELGSVFTNSTDLVDAGKKILVELVEKTGFTAHLAILEKDSVLYLVNVEPDHLKYLFGAVGQRREVYHSALGKCLTAWLPEEQILKVMEKCTFEKYTENTIGSLEQFLEELKRVRQVGFAVDKEEKALGAHCLGAPVRNKQGDVIAAISVSGYGVTDDKLMEMSMIVKSCAAQLSRRNGNFDH
jgi:DNA-binding IclR family transcriptional regulator